MTDVTVLLPAIGGLFAIAGGLFLISAGRYARRPAQVEHGLIVPLPVSWTPS